MDRLRLDILTIIFTESLTRIRVLRVFRGFFWGLLRKKSLGEIFFKMLLRKK